MSSSASKSSSKPLSKSSPCQSATAAAAAVAAAVTAAPRQGQLPTGTRSSRSSSASTSVTSPTTSAQVVVSSRSAAVRPSTSGARHANGSGAGSTPMASEAADGRSKSARANKQVVKAEVHHSAAGGGTRLQSPISQLGGGDDGRLPSASSHSGYALSSPVDGMEAGGRARHLMIAGGTSQVAPFSGDVRVPGSPSVDGLPQAAKTEEELEKMRILARHIKVCVKFVRAFMIGRGRTRQSRRRDRGCSNLRIGELKKTFLTTYKRCR